MYDYFGCSLRHKHAVLDLTSAIIYYYNYYLFIAFDKTKARYLKDIIL